tara:strand:- start:488 stop:667 length:180 start_codon:yes stop_codon:yes gene_type:complete
MDIFSFITSVVIFLSLLILVILLQILRNLIKKQIAEQLKDIIPVKSIRNRVGIRIKWKK